MNDRSNELPNVIPESVLADKRKIKELTRPRLCLTMALSEDWTQPGEETSVDLRFREIAASLDSAMEAIPPEPPIPFTPRER